MLRTEHREALMLSGYALWLLFDPCRFEPDWRWVINHSRRCL